jgi:hypothetical protein
MARREKFVRRRARGGRPAPGPGTAVRGGWAAVVAKVSAEATVFAFIACAITLAVLSQDPGAQAAPPRPAGHPTCYPPAAGAFGRATPESGQGVRNPSIRPEATAGPFAARRSGANRASPRGRG